MGETATLVGSYEIGELVPDFGLPTLDGGTARLSDFRGRPVLLFFTATWCPYCGAEAPYLEQEIWQRYRDRDLQVICIDVKENAGIMGPSSSATRGPSPCSSTTARCRCGSPP